MKKKKSNAGRKTVMTTEVIGKLEQAFSLGASISEATFYAGIHYDTYFEYCSKNPGYSDRVKQLQDRPLLLAREAIVSSFKKDPNLALKYLERKNKKEFALRTEYTGADGKALPVPILQTVINTKPNDSVSVHLGDSENPEAK